MNPTDKERFENLPLFAHKFLMGIPMHSLDRVELSGGRSGLTVLDIKDAAGFNTEKLDAGAGTKALFWLRGLLGRIFGWEDADELADSISFLPRLAIKDRNRSLVPPGKKEGISRVIYCFENEFWRRSSTKRCIVSG